MPATTIHGPRLRLAVWASVAALLVAVPLVAMAFTSEVKWSPLDFVFVLVLWGVLGVVYEFAAQRSSNATYRAAVIVALGTGAALIWVNGAAGIIGDEGNEANLLYAGVLAVAVLGAILARFAPNGMARALLAAALAQVAVGVVALAGNLGAEGRGWPLDVVMLTAFFATLWLIAAALFRNASRAVAPSAR